MNFQSNTKGKIPSLKSLREGLTETQKVVVEELWQHFLEKLQWPSTRNIYSRHEKSIVRAALSPLTGNVLSEQQNNGQNELVLSLLGVLLTKEGASYQGLLSRFFELQHRLFLESPDTKSISSEDIGKKLGIAPQELRVLGLLVRLGHISGGHGLGDNPTWNASAMAEAEDFPYGGTFISCVEKWLSKFMRPDSVVFKDELVDQQINFEDIVHPGNHTKPTIADHNTPSGNPLKKRYQVFVSSTYEDLIEERKHVMQALLASKCVPSGMELFPAASTEQWELIKSVIDDCDYYVVIVAGKYGSIGPKGKSYTEMEFDYAAKKQKSILGFYYSDIQSLPAKKNETTDQRRAQLYDFTKKSEISNVPSLDITRKFGFSSQNRNLQRYRDGS